MATLQSLWPSKSVVVFKSLSVCISFPHTLRGYWPSAGINGFHKAEFTDLF